MSYFNDEAEVYKYIGGVFRAADAVPGVGEKLRSANITLQLNYSDPASSLTVKFQDPLEVIDGGQDDNADVRLSMPADIANKYWRGEYNLAVGLAKGHVKAKGPVNKILKLVPLTKPIFPRYKAQLEEAGRDDLINV
jgi:putative sterol carrier protein